MDEEKSGERLKIDKMTMPIKNSIIILFLLCCKNSSSQSNLAWVNNYGTSSDYEMGKSITIDKWGNVITIGTSGLNTDYDPTTNASFTSFNNFIHKTNSDGYLIWVKSLENGINPKSVQTDLDNNIYISGTFTGTKDFDPGAGIYNMSSNSQPILLYTVFILKLDSLGNFIWAKNFGGPVDYTTTTNLFIRGNSIYMSGCFAGWLYFGNNYLLSDGDMDVFLLKLDLDGNVKWVKRTGGTEKELSYSIFVDGFENIVLLGTTEGSADFDPGPDTLLYSTIGLKDIFISKFDSSGTLIWAKFVGGISNESVYGITETNQNDIIVTGTFKGSVDFDPDSTNYTITNSTSTELSFILSLDSNGQFNWVNTYELYSSYLGDYKNLICDANSNIYGIFYFNDTVDFDASPNVLNLISYGGKDIGILKLNELGETQWAVNLGGDEDDSPNSIDINVNEEIFVTGYFSNISNFSTTTIPITLTSIGAKDVFILKLSDFVSIKENSNKNNFEVSIYPNPANEYLTVSSKENKILSIKITDVSGKLIQTYSNINQENYHIDLRKISLGIYFLMIETEKGWMKKKVVRN